MTNISVFEFDSQEIRFVDGKPVANDVAKILGYAEKAVSLSTNLSEEFPLYSVFDLLAIAVDLAENLRMEDSEKALSLVCHFKMVDCASSERLYHAARIHGAWKQDQINRSTTNETSFVYLIGCEGNRTMKIGMSCCPEKRIKQIQTTAPFSLLLLSKIVGGRSLEQMLHKEFAYLSIGNEWFGWSSDIVFRFENLERV